MNPANGISLHGGPLSKPWRVRARVKELRNKGDALIAAANQLPKEGPPSPRF